MFKTTAGPGPARNKSGYRTVERLVDMDGKEKMFISAR